MKYSEFSFKYVKTCPQIHVGPRPNLVDGIRTISEDGIRPIYWFHYIGRIPSSEIVRILPTISDGTRHGCADRFFNFFMKILNPS